MQDNRDDDDIVVREIDVYVNRIIPPADGSTSSTPASIHLLQYPLRPIYRPYGDQGRLDKVRYRPQQGVLEMKYILNMDSENFDSNKRAEILENMCVADSRGSAEAAASGMVEHVLDSMPCQSPHTSYGLGILKGNNLYLTPVSSILEFRPNLKQVDLEEETSRRRADAHFDRHGSKCSAPDSTSDPTMSTTPTGENATSASPRFPPTNAKRSTTPKKAEGSSSNAPSASDNVSPREASRSTTSLVASPISRGTPSTPFTLPPKVEWPRYPAPKIRDLLLSEPWSDIDAFYDPDTPESHEVMELLTTFEVYVPAAGKEIDEEANGIGDPALRMLSSPDKNQLTTEENEPRLIRKRVTGGPLVPKVRFSADFKSYIDRLCSTNISGGESAEEKTDQQTQSGPLSYLSLSRLTLDQQVLAVLKHRHIESFSTIRSLLTLPCSDDDLVAHLKSYGHVVWGNWVCKSELLYEGLVVHCRDLLVCLMTLGRPIVRDKVKPYLGNLSMEKLTALLKELAEYRSNAWHFKLPKDTGFIAQYPAIAKEGAEKFNSDSIKQIYEKIKAISLAQANLQQQLKQKPEPGKTAEQSAATAALAMLDPEMVSKAVLEALKTGGAQRVGSILAEVQRFLKEQVKELQPTSYRIALTAVEALQAEDITLLLPRVAEDMGREYWILRHTGSSQIDRHRDVILGIFKRRALNSDLGENKVGISRAAIMKEFSQTGVKFDLPDFAFRKVMREFAVNKNGYWVFKGHV